MPGKMNASLNEKLQAVKWGEYEFQQIFNRIEQGQRLKKDDQIRGSIPFVMAGITNTGVVNYISNPVASFPKNSITIDIFGNTFYRDYAFGAGDDTGVYWNDSVEYSRGAMLFFAVAMQKALNGKFSYGKKLRSSQSFHFKMTLPTKDGKLDFDFMESFIAELEAQRIAELEAYLSVTGLKDTHLSFEEEQALKSLKHNEILFDEYKLTDIFDVKNAGNILAKEVVENSGTTPYLCAGSENNAVSSYITYRDELKTKGNCIFIGGKTFVVTYQENDFFSNDSHNLSLYLKDMSYQNKYTQMYLATCVYKSLKHKYSWGDSISNKKTQKDYVTLPTKNGKVDYECMATLISAIHKLVIRDVVQYSNDKISATKNVVSKKN